MIQQKKFLASSALMVAAIITLFSIFFLLARSQCAPVYDGGDANMGNPPSHHWEDCPERDFELENITDPILDTDPVWDTVIVDFRDDVTTADIRKFERLSGLSLEPISFQSSLHKIYRGRVPEGALPKIHAHVKRHMPGFFYQKIEGIEESFTIKSFAGGETPPGLAFPSDSYYQEDPLYQFQWHFDQINVEAAWDYKVFGQGQVVAIVDTGLAPGVPDENFPMHKPLRDFEHTKFVPGYDFVQGRAEAYDENGHGTHVGGTVAQSTGNGYGTAGIAHKAFLMPVRVLGRDGSGTSEQVADGIRFATENGAHIINLSLGSSQRSDIIEKAIQDALARGVFVVAAAGNSGQKAPSWPAAYKGVVAVAATQFDGHPAFYSQWGPFVRIAAPGGNTKVDQNNDGRPDGVLQETVQEGRPDKHSFSLFMGTSMAAPHVAATAALIRSLGITNPDTIWEIMENTADQSKLDTGEDPDDPDDDGDEGDNTLDNNALYGKNKRGKTYPEKEFGERYGAGVLDAGTAVHAAIWVPGNYRVRTALILALLLFFLSRKKDFLDVGIAQISLFFAFSVLFSAGLYFLTGLLGGFFPLALTLSPVRWEFAVFGWAPLTPLTLLITPILAVIFNHTRYARYVALGVITGIAAFYLAEAYLMTAPIWLLGAGWLARAALVAAGVSQAFLVYFVLGK